MPETHLAASYQGSLEGASEVARIGALRRAVLAAPAILFLAASALFSREFVILTATFYFVAYFYFFPDVLGFRIRKRGSCLRRWSVLVRAAVLLSIAYCILVFVRSLAASSGQTSTSDESSAAQYMILAVIALISVCLLFAAAAASERYLAYTLPSGENAAPQGALLRWAGTIGYACVRWLSAKRSTLCGSVLLLISLLLNITTSACGNFPGKGYEILVGRAEWVTARQVPNKDRISEAILAQAGRSAYVLALGVAAASLACVAAGRRGDRFRRSRALAVVTGSFGLYFVVDFMLGWSFQSESLVPSLFRIAIWATVWVIPIVLWIRYRHRQELWNYLRLAIMIALLPALLFTCTMGVLTAVAFDLAGLGGLLFGLFLLWWGAVQARQELGNAMATSP
ncbi:MAG TPA: hypothetical protein VMU05_02095 [Dongiaceae bacterium]|nr:hypothetical protein [Dongiaceae bacterium]